MHPTASTSFLMHEHFLLFVCSLKEAQLLFFQYIACLWSESLYAAFFKSLLINAAVKLKKNTILQNGNMVVMFPNYHISFIWYLNVPMSVLIEVHCNCVNSEL